MAATCREWEEGGNKKNLSWLPAPDPNSDRDVVHGTLSVNLWSIASNDQTILDLLKCTVSVGKVS